MGNTSIRILLVTMKNRLVQIGFWFGLLSLLIGCTSSSSTPSQVTVQVLAGSNFTNVLEELGHRYELDHPNIKIQFQFASSGVLYQQIKHGGAADLFFSANSFYMDELERQGYLKVESRMNMIQNDLVLVRPLSGKITIKEWQDLVSDRDVRLAIGLPDSVPVGKYSKQTLGSLGLWETLQDRIVYGSNVREILTYVETGNVDAGIVYRSDALQSKRVITVAQAPTKSHDPIIMPVALINNSKQKEQALGFLEFLTTKGATDLFLHYGYAIDGRTAALPGENPTVGEPGDFGNHPFRFDWDSVFPIIISLKVGLFAAVVVLIVGTGLAHRMKISHFRGKEIVDAALTLPLVLPPTVIGFFLLIMLGKQSVFGQFLFESFGWEIVFTWWGAAIAATVVAFPLMYQSARAAFDTVDPNLENVARSLGSGEWKVFFTVTLPLAKEGIGAGLVLSFARAIGEFGATLMIAGNIPGVTQTLPLAIYSAAEAGNMTLAGIWVLIITLISFAVVVWLNYYRNKIGRKHVRSRGESRYDAKRTSD
jgi:molybdate transport system permease protein